MVSGRCPPIVGIVCASFAGACATKTDSGSHRGVGDAGAEAGAATGVLDAAPRLPDAILVYDVDGTAEKCAPWRRIIDAAYGQLGCNKGCCPTDPPVVPQIPDAG